MRSVLRLTVLVGMLLALGAIAPAGAGAVAFSLNSPITISPGACVADPLQQPASPYPSSITVADLTGTITDVNVTLTGLTHPDTRDLRVLLVGPQGQSTLLMHEAGGNALGAPNVTFDDAAAGFVPDPVVSGTYKPTQTEAGCPFVSAQDPLPAPAPAPPYGTTLAGFNGTNPNGTWNLYVVSTRGGFFGVIQVGWTLDITTAAVPYPGILAVERLAVSGRTLSFRMIAPAKVRFTLDRRTAPKRYRRIGSFVRKARRGRNRVRIPRRLNGRRVVKGVYRLSARTVGGGMPSGPLSRRIVRVR